MYNIELYLCMHKLKFPKTFTSSKRCIESMDTMN